MARVFLRADRKSTRLNSSHPYISSLSLHDALPISELSTAVQEGANVKIAIMNNNFLGMVRQWQEFFFEKRYSAVNMRTPDFVKIAEAHGIPGRLVTKPEEVQDAIAFARTTPGPVLLEFRVEQEEADFPMVPTGAALDQMLRRPVRQES